MTRRDNTSETAAAAVSDPVRSLLIVVPREREDVYDSLRRSFRDDPKVEIVLDRRAADRRGPAASHEPERRQGERRRRAALEAELAAGRWIAVPISGIALDLLDADTRAILFLYCGEHVVACQHCQMTYRLRWLSRSGAAGYACPRCGADMATAITAHARTCWAWTTRTGHAKPPAKVAAESPRPTAATG
jgi:hypothetical protein